MTISKKIMITICMIILVACSNEQATVKTKNVNVSDLDQSLQTWIENNSNEVGIYVKKITGDHVQTEDISYLVYSRKELSYDYRITKSKYKDGTLSIYLNDKMASNDHYVKKESLAIITLNTQPNKIELYLNDEKANFKLE
ncbi:hypothetical protein [Paenibacillus sp. YYML68]|uniref:hypothetical protein n=1 Tax=Paenibacillus sp. YYML68 TaxID=2909250 RepID=UPI0024903DE4|nr:hypothetical protein [Paenibacillus sp. YYML68]